jgi:hypothetical protein
MTPSDWIRSRRHHDNARAAEIIAMALKPGTHTGIPLTSTGHKTKLAHGRMVDGKLVIDTPPAPPHVRAGRRRKANKVTGARAAK